MLTITDIRGLVTGYLLLASGGSLRADDFYVNPAGDDAANGSLAAPWRTISHALAAVPAGRRQAIHLSAGTFVEDRLLTVPSGVSLMGAGKATSTIQVKQFFSLTEAVPNANPHVNTFPGKFVIQLGGMDQTISGFKLDGQDKRCHGGLLAERSDRLLIEDLQVENFRFCGIWVIDADNTEIRDCYLKNNTYGNPAAAGKGGGDSGSLMYHRGKKLLVHDNTIIEEGNVKPDKGGYPIKGQNRGYGGDPKPLEDARFYNNVLQAPQHGAWENGMAPAITLEALTVTMKNVEIHNNWINNHVSLPAATQGRGVRIHHNYFNLGRVRYAYGIENALNDVEIDHNYFYGGIYPLANWNKDANYRNHNIHHNIFHGACAGWMKGRELLKYAGNVDNLRFINNTVIDDEGIGRIFALGRYGKAEICNNLFYRPSGAGDNWGAVNGTITHNAFHNLTPHGTPSIAGDPLITLETNKPFQAAFYTIGPGSPLVDAGSIMPPWTDGFAGIAPDIGALEKGGAPFVVGVPGKPVTKK
jgi:hypothetical protein